MVLRGYSCLLRYHSWRTYVVLDIELGSAQLNLSICHLKPSPGQIMLVLCYKTHCGCHIRVRSSGSNALIQMPPNPLLLPEVIALFCNPSYLGPAPAFSSV